MSDVIQNTRAVCERNRRDYEELAKMTGQTVAQIETDTTAPDLQEEMVGKQATLRSTEVYIVEYHAGGSGASRKLLCDYAPHFYRLETENGTEVHLAETTSPGLTASTHRQALGRERNHKEEAMSAASDLITKLEKETGHRIDEEDSPAMVGLLGAMARKMGLSPDTYQERDDVAAGIAIQGSGQSKNDPLITLLALALFGEAEQ